MWNLTNQKELILILDFKEHNSSVKNWVFRRYHVWNSPLRWIDPFGFFGSSYGLVELGKYGPTSSEFMKERNIKPLAPVLMHTVPFTVGLLVTAYTENQNYAD